MRWLYAPLMAPLLSGMAMVYGWGSLPPEAQQVRPYDDGMNVGVAYDWRGVPCRSGAWGVDLGPVEALFGTVCEGDPWAR
jgi:hypothetical protein